jgi:hypothetical protein
VEFSSAQFVQKLRQRNGCGVVWVLFFFNFWHLCFNLTINLLGLTIALGFTGIYWDLLPVTWAGPGAGHHFGHAACLAQWIQTCESRNQD